VRPSSPERPAATPRFCSAAFPAAGRQTASARPPNYTEAVQILEALKTTGEIDGTDLKTLQEARGKLGALQAGR
jgi:hypothetical protein